jgi:hypothetical protein
MTKTKAPDDNRLRIEYVALSQIKLWDKNPKRHDVGGLIESFKKYGFKDPMKFEPTLNRGRGGVVEGNGRTEALTVMYEAGEGAPRGVGVVNGGEWAVPVLFGVDAKSRAEAEAYAIDHNNLTVAGGFFGPGWIEKLYDGEALGDVLVRLHKSKNMPVSVTGDDLDDLVQSLNTGPPPDWSNPEDKADSDHQCPSCGYEWKGQSK